MYNILFSLISFSCFFQIQCKFTNGKANDYSFEISVIHFNDFHARFEEVNENSVTCKETDSTCIGGIARVYTAVTHLLQTRPNSVFLNIGDNFQGTLWYNLFKWNVTQEFINKLPTDAITLGNHEFDDGISGVVPFLKSLDAPVVVANIDATNEPDMMGLFNKSVIIERNGTRIGIIGALLARTPKMSNTEDLVFLPESASINEEADRLIAEDSVDTIIVVSHCGYEIDQEIAANASKKIGLIVGAHSHTFLYTGDNPPGPDTPAGDYPTVVEHADGRKILVVQASAYTKYLGNITVYYDSNGDVVDWDGAPIFLDDNYTKDATIEEELQPWKAVVDEYGSVIVGSTEIELSNNNCYSSECLMANVIADSMAYSFKGESSLNYPPIGIINSGGVRTGLSVGNITYSDAAQVVPFENTIIYGEITGKELIDGLNKSSDDSLLHTSYALRVNYTSSFIVISVEVYCSGCPEPSFIPVNEDENYLVMIPDFFITSEVYNSLHKNMSEQITGSVDIDAFTEYLSAISPITSVDTGRLNIINSEDTSEDEVTESDTDTETDTDESGSVPLQKPYLFIIVMPLIVFIFNRNY